MAIGDSRIHRGDIAFSALRVAHLKAAKNDATEIVVKAAVDLLLWMCPPECVLGCSGAIRAALEEKRYLRSNATPH